MPTYIADLHIHSRFSLATSSKLTIPHLAGWAICKGINVLGTGDFTHPKWREELHNELSFDETSGFYTMLGKPEHILSEDETGIAHPPLFCLQTEISSIYKRQGKVRKVHNVVLMPTLEDADAFSKKLGTIGNINSDGRPILGLDAHDLLELVLETSDRAVLIPAHIWTPWFSLFGSRSGFNDIHDCFADLTPHIFALETGLSSDPAMNRLVSALDNYVLISNSDAHSGANLGREANLFSGTPSYDGMLDALRCSASHSTNGSKFGSHFDGTLEFYPEEGKYHLDGHRACKVVMTPDEAESCNNICPVCGKPLTIGVLHRVWELADRKIPKKLQAEPLVHPVIPLPTVLAELLGSGVGSKKVQQTFFDVLSRLGSEFAILTSLPLETINHFSEPLCEAVRRLREGNVTRHGGYDGEFGTISLFTESERKELMGRGTGIKKSLPILQIAHCNPRKDKQSPMALASKKMGTAVTGGMGQTAGNLQNFLDLENEKRTPTFPFNLKKISSNVKNKSVEKKSSLLEALTEEQKTACTFVKGPLLVLAGPGSGKTHLLVARLAWLMKEKSIPANNIVALTFSRRAAAEIAPRLTAFCTNNSGSLPVCCTFHSLAWKLLRTQNKQCVLLSEQSANALLKKASLEVLPEADAHSVRTYMDEIALLRETGKNPPVGTPEERILTCYERSKKTSTFQFFDFTDLLEWMRKALADGSLDFHPQEVLVDEVQDLSELQISILRLLLPKDGNGFFGIGNPNQAIYGFRGSRGDISQQLQILWPGLTLISLKKSFRSSQKILTVAGKAMLSKPVSGLLTAVRDLESTLDFFEASTQKEEELWIAKKIGRLLGSTSHTLLENTKSLSPLDGALAPSDIAVLVRLRAEIPSLAATLRQQGIPVQAPAEELFWQDETTASIIAAVEDALNKNTTKEEQNTSKAFILSYGEGRAVLPPMQQIDILQKQNGINESYFDTLNWKKLCKAYAQAGNWQQLLNTIKWLDEAESLKNSAESVQVLTIHAAKGLEFRAVFIPGMEDGLLPFSRSLFFKTQTRFTEDPIGEERRLFYVALTRASEAIYLSLSKKEPFMEKSFHYPLLHI